MKKNCLFSAPFSFFREEDFAKFEKIFNVQYEEIWSEDEIGDCNDIEVWICNPGQNFTITDSVLSYFPKIKLIVTPSTGTNHINRDVCFSKGIKVLGLLDNKNDLQSIRASSEFTFLLILNSLRRLDIALLEYKEKRWRDREDELRGFELYGKKVGIVGLGRNGGNVARWCKEFGAQVSYFDPYVNSATFEKISIEGLFSASDIICITCTLSDETKSMINLNLLNSLKKNAVLVNTSRGEVIDENDLASVLSNRDDLIISLDVLSGEVEDAQFNSPLYSYAQDGRLLVTPHISGATIDSQLKAAHISFKLAKNNIYASK